MKANKESTLDLVLSIVLGAVAFFSIRSLFQSDSSNIISNHGKEYIQDWNNLNTLNSKFEENERSGNQHKEIVI